MLKQNNLMNFYNQESTGGEENPEETPEEETPETPEEEETV